MVDDILGGVTEFSGSDRFRILSRLGAGAMGVVYRARDNERGGDVALKVLKQVDAAGIYRFKQEFRSLADMVHPNLVQLYELVASGDQWFFTMELVDGSDFLRFVRGNDGSAESAELPTQTVTRSDATADTVVTNRFATGPESQPSRPQRALSQPAQFERLREALGQLAAGVRALHRAGQLHRDLKPSNVLVTDDARVVVLDFGVTTALEHQRRSDRTQRVIGTPAYMAPEQAIGAPLTEASDWYAVGCMLYEAMTGRRPFEGAPEAVLAMKRQRDPVPVRSLCPDAPPDVAGLCDHLLARAPEERPNDDAMSTYTGSLDGDVPATVESLPAPVGDTLLLGRDDEMATLRAAFASVTAGKPATVKVHGASGMGKSTLVTHFLDELEATEAAIVLRGRCFERESVPYKAVDSVLDAVAHYLRRLPRERAWTLMPDNVSALARLFPVLRQVEAVLASSAVGVDSTDPHEQRRRAFRALRDLLGAIARQRPLVISIDDLQWGDIDSAALLEETLTPPSAPPLLLVAAYRTEEAASSVFLREFLPQHAAAVEIELGPLTAERARELANALWPGAPQTSAIARESGGNPFFVQELVTYIRDSVVSLSDVQLEQVVLARLDQLPDAARDLLSVVAVAGLPIEQGIAMRAAGVSRDDRTPIALLRAAKLVRTGGTRARDPIESYHDRIRETVALSLPPDELREIHERLAFTLEAAGSPDPEAVAVHFAGAGKNVRAARFYEAAAGNATDALAFDRAVALYERAIELHPRSGPDGLPLRRKMGAALSNAGRGAEAARVYLEAATGASPDDALGLRRMAAEELLHSGHVDEGSKVIAEVLHAAGVTGPSTPRRVLASVAWRRALVALRGLRFTPRHASEIAPAELRYIDACWSASIGYGMVDSVRGADYQARHLLRSLRAGEPERVARALAAEACYRCAEGTPRSSRAAKKIAERAQKLADEMDDPLTNGWVSGAAALVAYMAGRWSDARDLSTRAHELLQRPGRGFWWELTVTELYHLWALFQLGDIAEMQRRVPALLRRAVARGDRYSLTNLSTGLPNMIWLFRDDPDDARDASEQAIAQWPSNTVHLQHYWHAYGLAHVDMYEGRALDGANRMIELWPRLDKALLLRLRMLRSEGTCLRARCDIAAARDGAAGSHLRDAKRATVRVARSGIVSFDVLAEMLRGCIADVDGDASRAVRSLEAAVAGFERHGMALWAAAARRRLGLVLAGDEGGALVRAADDWMRRRGIVNPERIAAVLAP